MGITSFIRLIFGAVAPRSDATMLDGTTEAALARSLSALPPDERGWITFAEARILFSTESAQYAFGETDQDGRRNIESFAVQHRSVINFMSFRLLYAMIIISLDRRKILHFGVTEHPTQEWLAGEVLRAFAKNPRPAYLIRDRDRCYGRKFSEQVRQLGIRERITAPQSPSQNTYVERTIWSIRRECLNHIFVMSDRHLRHILLS